jgi:RNA polymerase sigma factor (sigma-70 family)
MTIQEPENDARARKQAGHRYEAARRDLALMLERKLNSDTRLATRELDKVLERRTTLERASHMLVPLSRFIDRELRKYVDEGRIEAELVEIEDILMAAIVTAHEELPDQIDSRGLYPWLRRVSQSHVRRAAHVEEERAQNERSLDAPIRIAGPEWPDRVLLLREVLADQSAVLPEEILQQREVVALLEDALDSLPERWREVFLLRSVDAWDDDEIAAVEGIDTAEVEIINLAARAYLRERLRESEAFELE